MSYLYYYLAFYIITTLIIHIYFARENIDFKSSLIYKTIVNIYKNLIKNNNNKISGVFKYILMIVFLPFVLMIPLSIEMNIKKEKKLKELSKEHKLKEIQELQQEQESDKNLRHFFNSCVMDQKTKQIYLKLLDKNKETLELFNSQNKINFVYIINMYLNTLNKEIDDKITFNFNNNDFKNLLKENLKISNDKYLNEFILSFEKDMINFVRLYNRSSPFKKFYDNISQRQLFLNENNSFYFINKNKQQING